MQWAWIRSARYSACRRAGTVTFPRAKSDLVGDCHQIAQQLSLLGYSANTRLSIVHSDRVISNSEKPSLALRHSAGSSMGIAINLVADNQADACVSGGNTGALMALSRFRLKLLPGIDRPRWFQHCPPYPVAKPGCLI